MTKTPQSISEAVNRAIERAEIATSLAASTSKTATDLAAKTAESNAVIVTDINYLKKDMGQIQVDVKSILENHLPHLNEKVSSLGTKITLFTAINIGGIILGVLLTRFFK